MDDRYGLRALFNFGIEGNSISSMQSVRTGLQGVIKAVRDLKNETLNTGDIGKNLGSVARQVSRSFNNSNKNIDEATKASKAASKQLQNLKSEFRALRAESRNSIDFGDLTDDQGLRRATQETKKYTEALRSLENQVEKNSTAGREFSATLQSQQRMANNRVALQQEERRAARAAQKVGASQALRTTGRSILSSLSGPIREAQELQQSFGTIKKLAGDLDDLAFKDVQKEVLNLSAALGVADTDVSAIFEDLASAGKNFSDQIGDRFKEVDQVVRNSKALDITTEKASLLNITLGAKFKDSMSNYAGGITELNARAASAINVLSDELQDVRISAQDVIPTLNVMINSIGDAKNFPIDQLAAFSAGISSLGTIEPEAAGSFWLRFGKAMSGNAEAYAEALNMSDEQFDKAVNTDKLGILLKLADAYKKVEGGELVQGTFLSDLGVRSSQDQKLVQGVANSFKVFEDARIAAAKGFYGTPGKELSVTAEIGRLMDTSAFQAKRFAESITALKHTLGLAIQDALTPYMKLLSDFIGQTLILTQKYPKFTKILAISTFGFGALAVAVGTAGVVMFTFQQAASTSAIAVMSLQRGIIPLTGFYEASMAAFQGGGLFSGGLHLLRGSAVALLSPLSMLGSLIGFIVNPITIALSAFIGLYALIQKLNPEVNLLSVAMTGLAQPLGYVFGFLKGLGSGLAKEMSPAIASLRGTLSPVVTGITSALKSASEAFQYFSTTGEIAGAEIAKKLVAAFSVVQLKWGAMISWLSATLQRLVDFVQGIGKRIVSALAENSPGPTFLIRQKWEYTITYVASLLQRLWQAAKDVGDRIKNTFIQTVTSIQSTWSQGIDYIRNLLLDNSWLAYGLRAISRTILIDLFDTLFEVESAMTHFFSRMLTVGNISGSLLPKSLFESFDLLIDLTLGSAAAFGNNLLKQIHFLQPAFSSLRLSILGLFNTFPVLQRFFGIFRSLLATSVRIAPVLEPIGIALLGFRSTVLPLATALIVLTDVIRLQYAVFKSLQEKFPSVEPLVRALESADTAITTVSTHLGNLGLLMADVVRSIEFVWQILSQRIPVLWAEALNKTTSFDLQDLATNLESNIAQAIASGFKSLVTIVPDTVRGVFKRLNLANFLLLFASSLPFGLFAGETQGFVLRALAGIFPSIAFVLGEGAFGALVQAIAFALPALTSILVASGVSDKIFDFFGSTIAQGINFATQTLGLELPEWVDTVTKFIDYLDRFFSSVGQFVTSLPQPVFLLATGGAALAVLERFRQAIDFSEKFVIQVGGFDNALALAGQALRSLLSPLRVVGRAIADFLSGPPPEILKFITPLINGIKSIARALTPVFQNLATLLEPMFAMLNSGLIALQANFALILQTLMKNPIFAQMMPLLSMLGSFAGGIGGLAISAGLTVAKGVQAGGEAVRTGTKTAFELLAPRILQAGELSAKLLSSLVVIFAQIAKPLLKFLVQAGKGLATAALAPIGLAGQALNLSNLKNLSQQAGRVTPIDLLPFFEDVRIRKIQENSRVLLKQLTPLGRFLTQLRYLFLPLSEVILGFGLVLVVLEGYLRATNSQFSIFGTVATVAIKTAEFTRLAIAGLKVAFASLLYVLLDLSNKAIPLAIAETTPDAVKTVSKALKIMRDAFIVVGKIAMFALKGIAIAFKQLYNILVLTGVIPALQVLKVGLVVVRSIFQILTGDLTPLSQLLGKVANAFFILGKSVSATSDVWMPFLLAVGALATPAIGIPLAIIIEFTRGFRDLRNIANLTGKTFSMLGSQIRRFAGEIAQVAALLILYFNFGAPWTAAIVSLVGWVYEASQGFKNFKAIIATLQTAINGLNDAIAALLKSVFAPLGLGPLEGIVKFFQANWPFLIAGLLLFNMIVTKNIGEGFKRTFAIIPTSINLVTKSLSVLIGTLSQLLPFFNRFRREAATLQVETAAYEARSFQGQYLGGGIPFTPANQKELGRRQDTTKFRAMLEEAVMEEARQQFIQRKRSRTETVRFGDTYKKRAVNPRNGSLDPRNLIDKLEARTMQFNDPQLLKARESVLKNTKSMDAIAKKSGLGGMSLPQLQALSTRPGADTYVNQGYLPRIDLQEVWIEAGEVTLSTKYTTGPRNGVNTKESQDLAEKGLAGSAYKFATIAKDAKDLGYIQNFKGDDIIQSIIEARREEIAKKKLPPMNRGVEESISNLVKQIESLRLDDLRTLSGYLGVGGPMGRRTPPELEKMEAYIKRFQITKHIQNAISGETGNFYNYNPKGYAEINSLMQDPKQFKRFMEEQGYDDKFIQQSQLTAKKSQQKYANRKMQEFYAQQKNELISSLMASELSLATSEKAAPDLFYSSPTADQRMGKGKVSNTLLDDKRGLTERYFGAPNYTQKVSQLQQKQETKSVRKAAIERGLINLQKGTDVIESAFAQFTGLDESMTNLFKAMPQKDKLAKIAKGLTGKGKEFKIFLSQFRAAMFLIDEGVLRGTPLEAMKHGSNIINQLRGGNFSEISLDAGQVLASAAGMDVEELVYGKKYSRPEKLKAERLRSQKVEELSRSAGYSDTTELFKESQIVDPFARKRVVKGDFGAGNTVTTMQTLASYLGMDENNFLEMMTTKSLLENHAKKPKNIANAFGSAFKLGNYPVIGDNYQRLSQGVGLSNQQQRLQKEIRNESSTRVSGLNALVSQTGGSLPDILSQIGAKGVSANDVRKQVGENPGRLAKLLGNDEYQRFLIAIGVSADSFVKTLEESAPTTILQKAEVNFYTAFKEYSEKASELFKTINDNTKTFTTSLLKSIRFDDRLMRPVQKMKSGYGMAKNAFTDKNKNNLNYMISDAGFKSSKEFVDHLMNLNVNKAATNEFLKGNVQGVGDGDLKQIAEALGLTKQVKKKGAGGGNKVENSTEGDISAFRRADFSVAPTANFKSFLQYATEEMFSNPQMRKHVIKNLQIASIRAVRASGRATVSALQAQPKQIIQSMIESVERFAYNLSVGKNGISGDATGNKLISEIRRSAAIAFQQVTKLAIAPLKFIERLTPDGTVLQNINSTYRQVTKKLALFARNTAKLAFSLENSMPEVFRGMSYIGKAFFKLSLRLYNLQSEYPTLKSAIDALFSNLKKGFQSLGQSFKQNFGKLVNLSLGYLNQLSPVQKIKDSIKKIPGFDQSSREARIQNVASIFGKISSRASNAALSAEQRLIKNKTTQGRGLAPSPNNASITSPYSKQIPIFDLKTFYKEERIGYDRDRQGNLVEKTAKIAYNEVVMQAKTTSQSLQKIEEKIKAGTFSPKMREYLEKKGYQISLDNDKYKEAAQLNGVLIKGLRNLSKTSTVTGELVSKALGNPAVYVLSRWTDVAIALGSGVFKNLKKNVVALGQGMKQTLQRSFTSAILLLANVAPQAIAPLWRLMRVLDTVGRLSGRVAQTIGTHLQAAFSNPATYAMARWMNTINFITGLFSRTWQAARSAGQKILHFFAENSPGPTAEIRDRYDETTVHVQKDLDQVAAHAQVAGQKIEGAIGGAATDSGGAFMKLQHAIMAVSGMGIGLTTIGSALEKSNPELGKTLVHLGEMAFAVDAVMGAVYSFQQFGGSLLEFFTDKGVLKFFGSIKTKVLGLFPVIESFTTGLRTQILTSTRNIGKKLSGYIAPKIPAVRQKFTELGTMAMTAFMNRWQGFKVSFGKMIQETLLLAQAKLIATRGLLAGAASKALDLGQPLLKAGASAAVQAGILIPANSAIAASYAQVSAAASGSSVAVVSSGGRKVLAVTTEAGAIIPLNFSIAGSFGVIASGAFGAATAVWAAIAPFVAFGFGVLAPFLPVIIGVGAAFAIFGLIMKTNLFGLGNAVRPLFEFTKGLLKIAAAVFVVASGFFFLRIIFTVVWKILSRVWEALFRITTTNKAVNKAAKSVGTNFWAWTAPIREIWKGLMTVVDLILGIGRGGKILDKVLDVVISAPLKALSILGAPFIEFVKFGFNVWRGIWKGAFTILSGIVGAATSLFTGFFDWLFIRFPQSMGFEAIQQSFSNLINWLSSRIVELAQTIGTSISSAISSSVTEIPFVKRFFGKKEKSLSEPVTNQPGQTQYKVNYTPFVNGAASITKPVEQITGAWQRASQNINSSINAIVPTAQVAGQDTINALNHSPTIRIPAAWRQATDQIISDVGGMVHGIIQASAKMVGTILGSIRALISTAIAAALAINLPFLPTLVLFGAIALAITAIATKFIDVKKVVSGVFEIFLGLLQIVSATLQLLKGLGQGFSTIFKGIATLNWETIKLGLSNLYDTVSIYFTKIRNAISRIIGGAITVLQGLFARLVQSVQKFYDKILEIPIVKSAINKVKIAISSLKIKFLNLSESIAASWEKVLSIINSVSEKINAVATKAATASNSVRGIFAGRKGKQTEEVVSAVIEGNIEQNVQSQSSNKQPEPNKGSKETETAAKATEQSVGKLDTIQGILNSVGAAIANFSPQLAAPVFMLTGAIDAFSSIKQAFPDIKEGLQSVAAVAKTKFAAAWRILGTSVNSAQIFLKGISATLQNRVKNSFQWLTTTLRSNVGEAVELFGDRFSGVSAAIGGTVGAIKDKLMVVAPALKGFIQGAITRITSLGIASWVSATLQSAGALLMSTSNAVVAASFKLLGISATAGWGAVIAPILTVVVAIGIVVAAIGLLWLAFKNNFLGIADIVNAVVGTFKLFFQFLIEGAWQSVASMGTTIVQEFQGIGQMLADFGRILIEPFFPLLELFGLRGGGEFSLAPAIKLLADIILAPLRILVFLVNVTLKAIGLLVKAFIFLAQILTIGVLLPVRLIVYAIVGVVRVVQFLGTVLFQAILLPFQVVWNIITAIGQLINLLIIQPIQSFFGAISSFLSKIPLIGGLFGGGKPVQQFASGGLVTGPGSSTGDRIPAFLSNREFVVNAESTQKNRSFLEAINRGESAESALELLSVTPPRIVMPPTSGAGGTNSVTSDRENQAGKIEINLNIGTLVLNGDSTQESAREFLDIISPELEKMVLQAMRDRAEKSR